MKKFVYGIAGAAIVAAAVVYYEDADTSGNNVDESKAGGGPPALVNPNENPARSYKINSERDTVLSIESGSRIKIPKNSFTDSSGAPVNGEVELLYREFHSVPEILLSGISMNYDSAGTKYFFESAGMFEINALKQGGKLLLADGKNIEVQMATLNADKDKFNQYFFNESEKLWEPVKKDEIIILKSPAAKKILAKKTSKDKAALEMPVKPRLAQKGKDQFMIEIPKGLYPELEMFNNVIFEVTGNGKKIDRRALNKTWASVTLNRADDGESYRVSFKKETEIYEITARPVFDTNDYKPALEKYNMLCAELRKKMNDGTVKKNTESGPELAEYLDAMKDYSNLLKKYQAYYADSVKSLEYRLSKEQLTNDVIYRSFQVKKLGIWNSDCPESMPKGVTFACDYKDESGNPIEPKTVFLLQKKRNMVINCYDLKRATYDPEQKNMLIILASGNLLCWVNSEDFPETAGTGTHTFTVKTLKKDHYTIKDIETIML